jgi:GNAT superfamily N-acetyltransferase
MNLPTATVHRATFGEIDTAFAFVGEYCEEVGVLARDNRAEFEERYFANGSGVWLAIVGAQTVGCVALRKLAAPENCAEIKRMYVRSAHRGKGIAELLLAALEDYAVKSGYEWLYLDTTDSMIAAARFYERNSYCHCARYNDNPQATIFMRKFIAR